MHCLPNPHRRFPAICPWSLHKLSEQTIAWMDDGWHFLDFYLPSEVLGMIYKMSGFWFLSLLFLAYVGNSMSHEDYYCSQTRFTWSSQFGHWNGDRRAILGPDSLFLTVLKVETEWTNLQCRPAPFTVILVWVLFNITSCRISKKEDFNLVHHKNDFSNDSSHHLTLPC